MEMDADPTQISTLVAQLVRNSIEAIQSAERPGKVRLILRGDQPGFVELSVTDNGPGIVSDEVRRHLFNPFFSGRSAGRGLGFGLCLVWQIVRMHGGIILQSPSQEGGTAFHIAFPSTRADFSVGNVPA
jgi:signal transduction histidine kinase